MTLGEALTALRRQLNSCDTPFAVVGGVAVSARTEPRFTRDVDAAVIVDSDEQAEHLIRAMTVVGWRLVAIVEQDVTGRLAQARMEPPGTDPVICDLLFASSGIERVLVAAAELVEVLPGVLVPVARRGHLIAMKLLSVDDSRLQDRLDLNALLSDASATDRREATLAVDAIMSGGTNRGRDLRAALAALAWPTST